MIQATLTAREDLTVQDTPGEPMTNEEKVKKLVEWIDPEERVTVHFFIWSSGQNGASEELSTIESSSCLNVTFMRPKVVTRC